jgi:type IV pilus assembly protein PilQ
MAVSYSDASSEILPNIEKIKTPDRGSLSVDVRTSQIIMTDTADKIQMARELIAKLDKPTPQVLIEARIVEASTSVLKNFGIEWSMTGKGALAANGSRVGDAAYTAGVNMPQPQSGSLGLTFTNIPGYFFDVVTAKISALETTSDGKVISSPKVLTLDNKAATITQGDSVPYITRDEAGNPTTEFKEIQLKLEVTPHVTADNRISMVVNVTNDTLKVFTGGTGSATSNVTTELLVNDGDTVVIGGIIKTTADTSNSGIPGLKDIPILGYLFKTRSNQVEKKELLVFITPRIVQLEQREM